MDLDDLIQGVADAINEGYVEGVTNADPVADGEDGFVRLTLDDGETIDLAIQTG